MAKYLKRSLVIEAVQFDGENRREILAFAFPGMSEVGLAGAEIMRLPIVIETPEGDMRVGPGDWVIRGVHGEVYPCKNAIFKATYDRFEG